MNLPVSKNTALPLAPQGMLKVLGKWFAALMCLTLPAGQASAAWFEAQGQALLAGKPKQQAREEATAEALKQAMLFAGASVHSVQTLANGLITEDSFQVQANGEVNQLELIDEIWKHGYVTVRIRADIFPKPEQCPAAGFQKTLVTTHFPIQYPQQALDGQLGQLSQVLPRQLKQRFAQHAPAVSIQAIAPYSANWYRREIIEQAPALARQHQAQYILGATITGLDVARSNASSLAFWQDDTDMRQFSLAITILDGMHGGTLMNKAYELTAPGNLTERRKLMLLPRSFGDLLMVKP
ncbi:flagellar assembly protein T N-terminal domain-containing protein [Salinimonas marina]|uniref:Flagellar assembly protein T N-terminal domain-containing protein n=1 Tax=Salinimonas marina TaxID=2785918 RepID=A0A7S9HCD1_9ALTE|nr:flagellar assembly protein T N-terminal domain-containing protein [Salinimonas marina]QPG04984.1 flagellar assembly protein T N-terminal domain-containing protein [Salinimonas marina]